MHAKVSFLQFASRWATVGWREKLCKKVSLREKRRAINVLSIPKRLLPFFLMKAETRFIVLDEISEAGERQANNFVTSTRFRSCQQGSRQQKKTDNKSFRKKSKITTNSLAMNSHGRGHRHISFHR